MTMPEWVCRDCGAKLSYPYTQQVPPIDDDEAWEEEAKEHNEGCRWVATKGHQEQEAPKGEDK